jgi:hypothetical protein
MSIFRRRGEDAIEVGAETLLIDPAEGLTDGEWLTEPPRMAPADPEPEPAHAAGGSGAESPLGELESVEDQDECVEFDSDALGLDDAREGDDARAKGWKPGGDSTARPLGPLIAIAAMCALVALVVLSNVGGGGAGSEEEQTDQVSGGIKRPTLPQERRPPTRPERKAQPAEDPPTNEHRRHGARPGRSGDEISKAPGPSPTSSAAGAAAPAPSALPTSPPAAPPVPAQGPAPAPEAPVDTAYQSEFGP